MILLSMLLAASGAFAQPLHRSAVAQLGTTREIKVAAAADLNAAMDKLAAAFEKQSGIHVVVSFGSSGNFFAQIQNGAPFDVFLSADRSYPEKLEQSGQTEGSIVSYARGELVLWTANPSLQLTWPSDQPLGLLRDSAVAKIAIANPEHAPYGRAAVAALKHAGIYDQVSSKIVLGENVSQAAQFAQSGNADVAIIALSLALSGPMQGSGHFVRVPPGYYPRIDQAAVVVKASQHQAEGRRFLEFLTSAEAQVILHNFGFTEGTQTSHAGALQK